MYHSRSTRTEDLAQCQALITDRFAYNRQELSALRTMWHHIMVTESGISRVICDSESDRVLAFGISGFVHDFDADAMREVRDPIRGRSIFRRWDAKLPILLNEEQIARANSEQGLNCVVLHHGYADLESPKREELWLALAEAFFGAHRGLFLRSFSHTIFTGGWMMPFFQKGTLEVEYEFSDLEAKVAGVPASSCPVVYIEVTAEKAKKTVGNLFLSRLFVFPPKALLDLNRSERALLRFALEGHTDKVLADILGVALSTIKKRWRIIQSTVRTKLPGVLPEAEFSLRIDSRGCEGRRHILAYVRDHPEELFPHHAP